MEPEIIREQFIEYFGFDQYKMFVLTLYEAFPLRDKLFIWQDQMLEKFCEQLKIEQITYEEIYLIFNTCPLHRVQLKKDIVPIVDGNKQCDIVFNQTVNYLFPFSNVDAPRDLERFAYPKEVEVYYCQDCRNIRMDVLAEEKMKNNR
jgi:hypothetical protein